MLRLEEIGRHNYIPVLYLSVKEEQKSFVASNAFSLAQAYAEPECIPLALYDGNAPVGFCMYCLDESDHEYWIYRLMIDARYQGKGFGREAMRILIERIRADRTKHMIYISFEPKNEAAKRLYESFGFTPDGRVLEGEVVYRLTYERQ